MFNDTDTFIKRASRHHYRDHLNRVFQRQNAARQSRRRNRNRNNRMEPQGNELHFSRSQSQTGFAQPEPMTQPIHEEVKIEAVSQSHSVNRSSVDQEQSSGITEETHSSNESFISTENFHFSKNQH